MKEKSELKTAFEACIRQLPDSIKKSFHIEFPNAPGVPDFIVYKVQALGWLEQEKDAWQSKASNEFFLRRYSSSALHPLAQPNYWITFDGTQTVLNDPHHSISVDEYPESFEKAMEQILVDPKTWNASLSKSQKIKMLLEEMNQRFYDDRINLF